MGKLALAINDLSCYSKSSLTVVLPVMEAMGIETAVLPTSLLSTQTDGFEEPYSFDLSSEMDAIYSRFMSLGIGFDGVYSGYLGNPRQIDIVKAVIKDQKALTLVDPVLGDGGSLYQTVTDEIASGMSELVRLSDVTTPNLTEARVITGRDPGGEASISKIEAIISDILSLGVPKGVVTSCMPGMNAAFDKDRILMIPFEEEGSGYPGTGDLFASVLLASLLNGEDIFRSAERATRIATRAVKATLGGRRERRRGIDVGKAIGAIIDESAYSCL